MAQTISSVCLVFFCSILDHEIRDVTGVQKGRAFQDRTCF